MSEKLAERLAAVRENNQRVRDAIAAIPAMRASPGPVVTLVRSDAAMATCPEEAGEIGRLIYRSSEPCQIVDYAELMREIEGAEPAKL